MVRYEEINSATLYQVEDIISCVDVDKITITKISFY